MFLIDGAHEGSGWRKDFVDEDEDSLLWRELDTFPDYVDELSHSEILKCRMSAISATIRESQLTDGTRYFFLSIVGISVLSAFSQITYIHESDHLGLSSRTNERTGIRSGYFWRILSASAFRFSTMEWQQSRSVRYRPWPRVIRTEGVLVLELGSHCWWDMGCVDWGNEVWRVGLGVFIAGGGRCRGRPTENGLRLRGFLTQRTQHAKAFRIRQLFHIT